ncbi:T-cell surface glycoprotein CD1c2-like [Lithobates pipiens]
MPGCLLCLLLSCVTVAECFELTFTQTTEVTEDMTIYPWGTAQIGGIITHAFHNNSKEITFTQSWSKGNLSEFEWDIFQMRLTNYFDYFKKHIIAKAQTAGMKGPFIVQCLTGCPANSGESLGMFYKLAFNGYNMVYLDVNLGIWVAEDANATQLEYTLNKDHDSTKSIQFFLNVVCQPLASSLLWSGKAILKRKLQPEVSFFRHHRDSVDELVCMVTGFYPESINVSLWRNRKHRMDGTVTTGTLPNGDNTYQIVTLVVLDEEEGQDLYCRVEHDSLTEPLMIQLENTKPPAGMIAGILIGFILLTAGLSWLVIRCKRNRMYTAIAGSTVDRSNL